jgi:hypothetical protein
MYFVEESIAAGGEQWGEARKEGRKSDGRRDGEGDGREGEHKHQHAITLSSRQLIEVDTCRD